MKNQKGQKKADRETRRESSSFSGEWELNLLNWDDELPEKWDTAKDLEILEATPFDSSLSDWETNIEKWEPLPEEWNTIPDQWEPLPDSWDWLNENQTKGTKADK